MKYILAFLTFIPLFYPDAYAQADISKKPQYFTIQGKLSGRNTGYLILQRPDSLGSWIKDTAYLKNGNFNFSGWIKEPSYAHIIGSQTDGNYSSFFLEGADQTITLEEGKFNNILVHGSATQKEYDSLISAKRYMENQMNLLSSEYDSCLNAAKDGFVSNEFKKYTDSLAENIHLLSNRLNSLPIEFIKTNPNSYLSSNSLYWILTSPNLYLYSYNLLKSAFESLSHNTRTGKVGDLCSIELRKFSRSNIDSIAPGFKSISVTGERVNLSNYKGKFILLDFWASWCVPCRENTIRFKQEYEHYQAKGLKIIGISLDTDTIKWKNAIKEDGIQSWTHILSKNKNINEHPDIGDTYYVKSIPAYILIDKNGIIIGRKPEVNIEKMLKELFGE